MITIRVVIADDDDDVRDALVEVVGADPRLVVVGTARSGDEAVAVCAATRPDVVLLDVRMPGGGAEAARRLTGPRPAPAVLAISAQTGSASVVAMLRAGAVGYLTKGRLTDLTDLVTRVAEGHVVLAVPGAADALRQLLPDVRYQDRTDVR